jgi:hypothetical protein
MATTKRAPRAKTSKSQKSAAPAAAPASAGIARVNTQAIDITTAIKRRAYELYEQRGRQHGRDKEDWLSAEAEVRSRFAATA